MAKIERRQHTDAYKKRMVAQVLKGTRNVEEIANANELSPSMLHTWKRDPRYGGDASLYPSYKRGQVLNGIPTVEKKSNSKAAVERRWKFCPNCGERLK